VFQKTDLHFWLLKNNVPMFKAFLASLKGDTINN